MAEVQAQTGARPVSQETEQTFDEFPVVDQGMGLVPESPKGGAAGFEDFPLAEPTTGELAGATARGAAGGLMETGGFAAGAGIGMAAGSLAGPAGTLVGGLAGGVGGFLAGREAREATVGTIEQEDPALRPFAVGGETFGAGLPFIAAPIGLGRAGVRMGSSMVGRFVNRILETAAKSPVSFAGAETAALTSAAIAGGAAEAYRPGEVLPRIAAEVSAGLLNPGRLVATAGRASWDSGKRVLQAMSRAGRETRAARVLREIIEEAGEDPAVVARLLKDSGIPGVNVTAAQKTGSPALGALEAKLRQESLRFGAEAQRMADDGLSTIEGTIRALRGTGDPQALRAAAEIRTRYFKTLLESRVKTAERQAIEAARKITADTPAARAQLGRQARAAADAALDEARTVERELWGRIPRDLDVVPQNIADRLASIQDELLPEETLPAVVTGLARRAKPKPENVPEAIQFLRESLGVVATETPERMKAMPSGELLRFRSRALGLAREADAQGRFNEARIFGQMAEAALDDLSNLGSAGGAIDEARAFSRALNDTFTRSFVGRAQATARTGAPRIPPEVMMRRAFASGRETAELQLQELDEATRFLARQGIDSPAAAENVELMLDAQERILRLAAAESVDPNSGRASATRLGKFVRDNDALLDRFPQVKSDLQAALTSEQHLKNIERVATRGSRVIGQEAVFAQVAKVENPVDAIRSIIGGNRPVRQLQSLAKAAARKGPDAVEGMKAAVWDHVFRQAGGDFSPDGIRRALLEPIRPGQPPLAELMTNAGVLEADEITRATQLLDQAGNIVQALRSGQQFETLMESPDALFDLVVRIAGAQAGGASVVGQTAGAPLVAAGAGSRFARNLFERVPQTRVRDVLIEAAKDPQFMALLLEKPATTPEKLQLARHIHAYLIQAGFEVAEGESQEREAQR